MSTPLVTGEEQVHLIVVKGLEHLPHSAGPQPNFTPQYSMTP